MFKLKLGLKVKDKITGFTGILIGRAEHMFGCNTYGVAPQVLENGKRLEAEWFDEGRLEMVDEGINPKEVTAKKRGSEYREHPHLK